MTQARQVTDACCRWSRWSLGHPHTFAADPAQAADVHIRILAELRSAPGLPDLWQVASELPGSP
ncbi:MAG: hypothetical protein ABI700_02935 [Chloroflexota bacterium]